jgi:uroporphyrinogen-III synthase
VEINNADMIKRILFSQNRPIDFERSPYAELVKKYGVEVSFYKFFQIDGVPVTEFRKNRISISDYTDIIMTNKPAIDHFFRIAKELKIKIPASVNYFCINATTANYVQKYTICRKRRMIYPEDGNPESLVSLIESQPSSNFLFPLAIDSSINQLVKLLDDKQINYTKAEVFNISFADVSKIIDIYSYDMVVFFSPYGIQTLMSSYPDFKQGNIIIGALGSRVIAAAKNVGLDVQVIAPTPEHPSIFSAIDTCLQKVNGGKR